MKFTRWILHNNQVQGFVERKRCFKNKCHYQVSCAHFYPLVRRTYCKCWLVCRLQQPCLPTKQLKQRSHCSTADPSPETHTRRRLYYQKSNYFAWYLSWWTSAKHSVTLAWSLSNGRVKSPWSSPFFSMNTTLCLLGWRLVLAIRLPEGLKHHSG